MTMVCVVQQVMIHRECLFLLLLSSGRQASCLGAPCLQQVFWVGHFVFISDVLCCRNWRLATSFAALR